MDRKTLIAAAAPAALAALGIGLLEALDRATAPRRAAAQAQALERALAAVAPAGFAGEYVVRDRTRDDVLLDRAGDGAPPDGADDGANGKPDGSLGDGFGGGLARDLARGGSGDIRRVYVFAGAPSHYALEIESGRAYNDSVRLLLGVGPDGRVTGARILAHRETPGLGDRITAAAWLAQLRGLGPASPPRAFIPAAAGGDFDGMTGATITARAVLAAVRDALRRFHAERGARRDRDAGRDTSAGRSTGAEHGAGHGADTLHSADAKHGAGHGAGATHSADAKRGAGHGADTPHSAGRDANANPDARRDAGRGAAGEAGG